MPQRIRNLLDKKGEQIYKIIFVLYTVFLFTVTLMPLNAFDSGQRGWLSFFKFDNFDKVVHALLFFLFTGIIHLTFRLKKIYSFTIAVLTGILIEILQYSLSLGRTFDLYDILFNAIGITVMIILIMLLEKKYSLPH